MMKKTKDILCLILARGESKRIPRKNIKMLGGKPLIAYTIECAKRSKYITRIVVSTDDSVIADVSKQFGAETPFLRPREISQDDSKEIDAFKHALRWLREHEGYEPDIIVKMFPTSPFRNTESVDAAIELLLGNPDADSVRSIRKCKEHPYKMWKIREDEQGRWLLPLIEDKPKESHTFSYHMLPVVYVQNASFDVVWTSVIWKKDSITGNNILSYVMSEDESTDINTEDDFALAERQIEMKKT